MRKLPAAVLLLCLTMVSSLYGSLFLETEALFIRSTGVPLEQTVSFLLNNAQIFTSSDFNQQVEWLEKPIAVAANNTLRVQLSSKPGGDAVSYSYNDTTNNLTGISNGDADLTWEYDGSLPTALGLSGAVNGNLALIYNNDYRVSSLSVNGGDAVSFSYNADGAISQAGALLVSRYPNGKLNATSIGTIDDSYAYNEFGDQTSYTARYLGGDIFSTEYTGIDKLGRITGKTETIDGVSRARHYSYDAVGQLTDVFEDGVLRSHYGYDGAGNRTGFTGSGGTITASFDDQDRMTAYGGNSYTYTANGELESKSNGSGTTQYAYDVLGNLKMVTLPNGVVIEYIVDGMNRRIGKKVNGVLTYGFVYKNQLCPVAQMDAAGNVVATFVYGTKINVPEYMVQNGVTYKIITDHLGSPRLVIDAESGQIAQRIDFDEFGNVTLNTNPGFQPFGFAGGLYDEQTGLVRFGARDYDAETGRWTCKDPIGFEGGDGNLYRYVGNSPFRFYDPYGLEDNGETFIESIGEYTQERIDILVISENEIGLKIVDRITIDITVPSKVFTQPDDEPYFLMGDPSLCNTSQKKLPEIIINNAKKIFGPSKENFNGPEIKSTSGIRG